MRLVAPFGFYGAGNIGDEATLVGFARLLARVGMHPHVTVGSRNPGHTTRVEPAFRYYDVMHRDWRKWRALLLANAQVFVGGTPIQDVLGEWPLSEVVPLVRAVDRWHVPLAFVGVGVEELQRQESRRAVAEEIAPRVSAWSVRSENDRARLQALGVGGTRITVASDMAWLIDPPTTEGGRARLSGWDVPAGPPLVGVNLVNENHVFDRMPAFADRLARALDEMVDASGAWVVFLANEIRADDHFDRAAALRIAQRMRHRERVSVAPSDYLTPMQMLEVIGCCRMTVSMRYHFCMFSALQGVPFIAIERTTKLSDLCDDLDWSGRTTPATLDESTVAGHAMRFLASGSGEVAAPLRNAVRRMKQRALLNAAPLASLGMRTDAEAASVIASPS